MRIRFICSTERLMRSLSLRFCVYADANMPFGNDILFNLSIMLVSYDTFVISAYVSEFVSVHGCNSVSCVQKATLTYSSRN